jgi:transcriptional regulator with XRE-family HTH domain
MIIPKGIRINPHFPRFDYFIPQISRIFNYNSAGLRISSRETRNFPNEILDNADFERYSFHTMTEIQPSPARITRNLDQGRTKLGLTLAEAAAMCGAGVETVRSWEAGKGAIGRTLGNIRKLCRAYMKRAVELGYDPGQFHESLLCPGEFPSPASPPVETEPQKEAGQQGVREVEEVA